MTRSLLNLIPLDQACREIHQGCDGEQRSPFFFVVGAGISCPAVPTATQIIEELSQQPQQKHIPVPTSPDPMRRYSEVLLSAFPHRIARQKYFRDKVSAAKITSANLHLAHLLSDQKVTDLVVTLNFDDLLTRALNLLGRQHIVCDHPRTVSRLTEGQDGVAVVHVHGSAAFYDCCNLGAEIGERAADAPDEYTMSTFLDATLHHRSPLVVGYSGWERDAFMLALQRRLRQVKQSPHRMYWFCYTRDELARLPQWLLDRGRTTSDDVCFVVPQHEETAPRAEPDVAMASPPTAVSKLDAAWVFDGLIRQFGVRQPDLFSDPLGFFARHLGRVQPEREEPQVQTTSYFFWEAFRRVSEALEWDQTRVAVRTGFREVTVAIRESRYDVAAERTMAMGEQLSNCTQYELHALFDAARDAVPRALQSTNRDALQILDWALHVGTVLLAKIPNNDNIQQLVADTLLDKGGLLGARGEDAGALECFDRALAIRPDGTGPDWLPRHIAALENRAIALGRLGRHQEAVRVCDEVVEKIGDQQDYFRNQRARALANKAVALWMAGEKEAAVLAYDTMLQKYDNWRIPPLSALGAQVWLNKAIALKDLGRNDEAVAAYDALERKLDTAPDRETLRFIARGMLNKCALLGELGRTEEVIDSCDRVILRLASSSNRDVLEQVAKAFANKSVALDKLERSAEAEATREELFQRFVQSPFPSLREVAADSLLFVAERKKHLGKADRAIADYQRVLDSLVGESEPRFDVAKARATCGLGQCYLVLQRHDEADETFRDLETRFGGSQDPRVVAWLVDGVMGRASILTAQDKADDALNAYEVAESLAVRSAADRFNAQLCGALMGKAITLGSLGRHDEALVGLNAAIAQFERSTDEQVRGKLAFGKQQRIGILARLGRTTEALAASDEFLQWFEAAAVPIDVVELLPQIHAQRGGLLLKAKRAEEAVTVFDRCIEFDTESAPAAVRDSAAKASYLKTIALAELGKTDEAQRAEDFVISRFATSDEPHLLQPVAAILLKQAERQSEVSPDDALVLFDQLVVRFAGNPDETLRSIAIPALNDSGFIQLRRAKQASAEGNDELFAELLVDARRRFERGLQIDADEPLLLGNLGYVAFLQGNDDEAKVHLTRAIELGGEPQRQHELNDAQIHPLQRDEDFKRLVRGIVVEQ